MTHHSYAIEHYMNPTRSLQNNREQSQKWNVREMREPAGKKRGRRVANICEHTTSTVDGVKE